jgi:alpha-glucuronidase
MSVAYLSCKGLAACRAGVFALVLFFSGMSANAEDGYRLWLRYDPLPTRVTSLYRSSISYIVVQGKSETLGALRAELTVGCAGLLSGSVPLAEEVNRDGALVVGTPSSSAIIARLKWTKRDRHSLKR